MILVIALALAILTFVFIAYPAFRQQPQEEAAQPDGRLQDLKSKRETTYSMLKELEFDHESGILTDEDYRDLEQKYRRKAVKILKDMDNVGTADEYGSEVATEAMAAEDPIERLVQRMRKVKAQFCSKCGARLIEDARFCAACGVEVGQGGAI